MGALGSVVFTLITTFLLFAGINQFTDYKLPIPIEIPEIPIWAFIGLFIVAVIAIVYNGNENKK